MLPVSFVIGQSQSDYFSSLKTIEGRQTTTTTKSETLCENVSVKVRFFDWMKSGLVKGVLWQQNVLMDHYGIVNDAFRKCRKGLLKIAVTV